MIPQRTGRCLLTGLAACLLFLTACGEDTEPAAQPTKTTVSDLAARPEADIRAALATLDPCDLLAAAKVEGKSGAAHSCADLGTNSVELRLGAPLDAHVTDPLATINGTYAVEVDGEPCRILVPASKLTGLEVIATDCETASEITSDVIDRLRSGDTALLGGVAAHDACALLGSSLKSPNPRLESRTLETCTAAAGSESGVPAGPNDGTTLTLQQIGQTPREVRKLHPGSSLATVAGQPVVISPAQADGCRVVVRLEPPSPSGGPFATLTTWADLVSTTQGCAGLRASAGRLVRAAETAPPSPSSTELVYAAS